MKLQHFDLSREQLEQVMHLAMCETLSELVRRKDLTSESAQRFQAECTPMVLCRESLLSSIADWVFGKERGTIKVVMAPLPKPDGQKEST